MPAAPTRLALEDPLTAIPGVGPARAGLLREHLGVATVGELLRRAPLRHEDAALPATLATAPDGRRVRIRARIRTTALFRRGRRSFLRVDLEDDTGRGRAWFFQAPWLRSRLPSGRELLLEGRIRREDGLPVLHAPRLLPAEPPPAWPLPVYGRREGLPPGLQGRAVAAALDLLGPVPDPLPVWLRERAGVPALGEALRWLHRPPHPGAVEAARRRLALGEVLDLHRRRRDAVRTGGGSPAPGEAWIWRRIRARLPFRLTADQEAALAALRRDLATGRPVRRLLHGEVGSGKTAVAFALALALAAEGRQTALLAPTEILARQHLATFRKWLRGARLQVAAILGDQDAAERRATLAAAASGRAGIVVGTHALLGPEVRFRDLGLVVFDEQHRFGVRQKAALLAKGRAPHVLTMTATPIPRTLAWARYGALDPLTLRSRPGGGEVRTRVLPMARLDAMAAALRHRLEGGARAFVVVPHVDGADGLRQQAARLLAGPWRGLPAGVVHGRLPGREVAATVARFRAGELRLLLGTTVVEVGLDVPGVGWMLVLDAQRLGLASLHQLRGRLARGPAAGRGRCLLFARGEGISRVRLLERCQDGFAVAAADLAARGPGALRGLRQHGRGDLEAFDPVRDEDLLELLRAREVRAWLGDAAREDGCSPGIRV